LFKNLNVGGEAGVYRVQLAGADADHAVRHVLFDHVSILGIPLTHNSPQVSIGQHVEEVRFTSSPHGQ
jgi:hypothetical protein